jgi:two-component system, NtrC family, nitrogen regulation sensor histidine kinase NtrY
MRKPAGLRRRLFWTLFLVALVPAGMTLGIGTLVLREMVASTGSAGPWMAVAESGRELLDLLSREDAGPAVAEAATRHREVLSESVRLSRIYAAIGDRIVLLIPAVGLLLLALVAFIAGVATRGLARGLAAPVEELAEWTRRIGSGQALPPPDEGRHGMDAAEFSALREGFREAEARLQEARERELEQAKTQHWAEMARRVAHEIKNPLTPMRMAAERVSRAPDPATAQAGAILLEEIGRLDELARSFSHFGRPVEGPAAPVDLRELLDGICRRLRAEGLEVETSLPPDGVVVPGHLSALERVVRNLVNNALEASSHATGGQGPVEVRLSTREGSAVVTVLDRGPGIPEELIHRIWEPNFTTRRRGTGLGLPLVRQAVRSHGGTITVANREGGGARFDVTLPIEERPPRSGGGERE